MKNIDEVLASDKLPSLPQVALRIIELSKSPEPDFVQAAEAIQCDPALSSQFLRISNSVLFGMRGRTSTVLDAIRKIGINMVQSVALSFYLAPQRNCTDEWNKLLQRYWWRSLIQASAAEDLGSQIDRSNASRFFFGGLLQDIGILALMNVDYEFYYPVFAGGEITRLRDREISEIGFDHLDVSRGLFQNWGIEAELVDGMLSHHHPIALSSLENYDSMTCVLRTASLIADRMLSPYEQPLPEANASELNGLMSQCFQIGTDEQLAFFDDIAKRVLEIADGLKISLGEFPSNEELLGNANQLLGDLAVKALMNQDAEGSLRDPLTGLYNRRKLDGVKVVSPNGPPEMVGVLFVDVDKFKEINDSLGHKVGDQAIQLVAEALEAAVRDDDIVIRYGGDEFVAVLRNVREGVLEKIAERVAAQLRRAREKFAPDVDLPTEFITLSIGGAYEEVSNLDELRESSIEHLIERADQAMYAAKRGGGDQICLAETVSG